MLYDKRKPSLADKIFKQAKEATKAVKSSGEKTRSVSSKKKGKKYEKK